MTTISLVATDQLLSVALQPKVASGDKNSVELHVDFDSEWDGYGKSAVFFTEDNKTVYEVVMTDGNCVIPHEVLAKAGTLYIGVRGVNTDNAVKTSSLVKYKIVEGAPSGDGTTVEPTLDVYQQLLVAYSQANARVNALVASHNSEGEETYRLDIYGDGTAWITIRSNGVNAFCTVSIPGIFGMGATRTYKLPEHFVPPYAHYEYDGDIELCIANEFDGYTTLTLKNKNQTEAKDGVWFQFVYSLEAVYVPKEVVDIRVGADGTIYETAGEAVRAQFRQVSGQGSGGAVSDEKIAAAVEAYMKNHPAPVASIATIYLPAAAWVGSFENLYSQVVDVPGVTKNSQVDLTPSVEQLSIFYNKSVAFVAENEDGVVTVYAIGQKPENDYTIQVTITEVSA